LFQWIDITEFASDANLTHVAATLTVKNAP